jgi:hypothetical protein
LPATMVFLMPMVAVSFREDHAIALWIIIGVWFVVTWIWSWQKMNAGSVGCYMTALHLVLIGLAECWTWEGPGGRRGEYPMAAMHPVYMIVGPLFRHDRSYQDPWTQHGTVMELCYWAGLAINLILVRFWLIRQFDRMVERVGTRPTSRRPVFARQQVVDHRPQLSELSSEVR